MIVSVRGIVLSVVGVGSFVFTLFRFVAGTPTATSIRLGGIAALVTIALHCMILISSRVGGDRETVIRRAQAYNAMTIGLAFGIFGIYLVFRGAEAVGFGLAIPGVVVAAFTLRRIAAMSLKERNTS